jgi:MFS family permease
MQNVLHILKKKDVLSLCATVFMADVVMVIVWPTFSLYAKSLGASLTLIGVLSAVVGLTRILSSVPIGMFSDTVGRKNILSAGTLFFAASSFLYTVVPNPYFLLPIQILAGWAMISTFFMGMAYLGDIVASDERGLAIGLYTTSLGLGFATGPLIGGTVAATYGYRASYRVAAVVALLGFVIARRGLVGSSSASQGSTITRQERASPPGLPLSARLRSMMEPNLLAASVANLLMSVVFSGAITNFFPLYAASLSVGEATIGSMFSIRALVSTLVRVPTGLLATKFSGRSLMVIALALVTIAVVSISYTTDPVALAALLTVEGITWGMFLTSGQTFVTQHAPDSDRGTAIGIWSTAGSVGATAGPFVLGLIADGWGIATVFRVTGAMVSIGVALLWSMSLRQHRVPVPEV